MTTTRFVSCLLPMVPMLALAMTGCATHSAGEVTTDDCPAPHVSTQGFQPQGFQPQGFQPQGFQPQGFQPQGFQPQGIELRGFGAAGLHDVNGIALRGVTPEQADSWLAGGGPDLEAEQVVSIELERGVLSGRGASGEDVGEADLVGLLVPFLDGAGKPIWIEISAVSRHPDAPDLPMYALAMGGESLCADPLGGVFVPGIWDETGKRQDRISVGDRSVDTTFACTAGVIAKCVIWGYRPWSEGADLHEACTRMARADYCGDGVSHTENGTIIDIFDTRGIQSPVETSELTFEAGWDSSGAVCVRETRYVDTNTSGERVFPSCWADKPRCATFEEAVALGAELGNDSAHATRSLECGW